jgi:hypothetical protein
VTDNVRQGLRVVAAPFFEQGAALLFVSMCCNRIYVGISEPTKCRTCEKKPESQQLESLDGVNALVFASS